MVLIPSTWISQITACLQWWSCLIWLQTELLLRLNHYVLLLKDMLQVKSVMSSMCWGLKYHFSWSYSLLPLSQTMWAAVVISVSLNEGYMEFLVIMKAFSVSLSLLSQSLSPDLFPQMFHQLISLVLHVCLFRYYSCILTLLSWSRFLEANDNKIA